MEFIWFVLSAAGLTQILVYGSIFNKIRPKHEVLGGLFHCTMCMGFWVGLFLFFINGFTELFTFEYSLGNAFCLACLGSGTSYLLSVLVNDFGFRVSPRTGGENVGD